MRFCALNDICYAVLSGKAPSGSVRLDTPFAPLMPLLERDPADSEAAFAAACPADLFERGAARLLVNKASYGEEALMEYLSQREMRCINTAFPHARTFVQPFLPGRSGLRLHLIGLGEYGKEILTGLVLTGTAFDQIGIYDPDPRRCLRYEIEARQILPVYGHRPSIHPLSPDALFDCDVFVYAGTQSAFAPLSAAEAASAARERDRAALAPYAKAAREAGFSGLFFLLSDPGAALCRDLFILSNTPEAGALDYRGLKPEQIFGLHIGLMLARADFAAAKRGIRNFLKTGRVYGGAGTHLVVANALGKAYDDALSQELTQAALLAGRVPKGTRLKPAIAPALSGACAQINAAVAGESFYAAVSLDGAYMGTRARLTPSGLLPERANMPASLFTRVQASYAQLKELCQ